MASYSVPCPKTSAFASSVLRAENFQQQQQQSKVSFAGIGNRRHSLIGGSSSDLSLSARFQVSSFSSFVRFEFDLLAAVFNLLEIVLMGERLFLFLVICLLICSS